MPLPRIAAVVPLLIVAGVGADGPRTGPAGVLDLVAPQYRPAVAAVLAAPTLSGKAAEHPFRAHPAVYDWLLDHPDRCSVAWRRMSVPCVEITALGDGRFRYADGKGTEVTWRPVGKSADAVVWYASGQVNPGKALPTVPVKAVAVLRSPRAVTGDDPRVASFEPTVAAYVQTDSRAAAAVLRVIGPAAPRMADQAADQLLLFFSGPSRYVLRHPDEADVLLNPPDAK
jgi:hypothetical protein